ncbi:hypothetical protein B0H17DRAFT_1151363 [Mycena rosella]|uniref:Uncharacterized protein n=1 Tax=Mycena rosella TaxID=1033263 RepID=A0AAD7BLF2_MYCRO|nr:hypothetical protein B0H17DRAFT_1151363 [Mycena rosella]
MLIPLGALSADYSKTIPCSPEKLFSSSLSSWASLKFLPVRATMLNPVRDHLTSPYMPPRLHQLLASVAIAGVMRTAATEESIAPTWARRTHLYVRRARPAIRLNSALGRAAEARDPSVKMRCVREADAADSAVGDTVPWNYYFHDSGHTIDKAE